MKVPRDHQTAAINLLRASLRAGKRKPMLQLAISESLCHRITTIGDF